MASKMLHTCIRVKDLDKSLKFYKEALGLVETRRMDYPEYKFSLVYLSDKEDGYEVELTYNYDQEKPYDLGNGFSHIAVGVEDIEAERERHISLGYEVTPMKGLSDGAATYYFVTDPDGYKVEIIKL
ncbi:lactoylglutathione lyase [Clostridium perfringens]|uniref:lactoylglutathione lyase n=1 Tax=Clostridium perfringens TaxID=1502 RepID=UPI0013E328CA|nr:VOC family protein [Clostridium perfringens]NGT64025.1 lactoylglutathione lyase [Clostridium perfringens]